MELEKFLAHKDNLRAYHGVLIDSNCQERGLHEWCMNAWEDGYIPRLKNKTENKSIWEGAFYQNERIKITQVEIF